MTFSMDYERLHKLCFLDRDHLFGRTINNVYLLDRFSNRLGDVDKDPFIGYFGNEYELQKKKHNQMLTYLLCLTLLLLD